MSLLKLIKNSIFFYWQTSLGVVLTVALCTAILVGALLVGDSVSYSLKRRVDARLGKTKVAIAGQNFFRKKLGEEISNELGVHVAGVLQLRGLITNSDGTKRVNQVGVLGVDKNFFGIGNAENPFDQNPSGSIVLNTTLANRLGIKTGDQVVVRIAKPSLMPRDVPLTSDIDLSIVHRAEVLAIIGDSGFGGFSLQANQALPLNVFVPREWLEQKIERRFYVNLLLLASDSDKSITAEETNKALRKYCQLEDIGLEPDRLDKHNVVELRSRKIFIDDAVADAAMANRDDAFGILTYFVNELRIGERATPYSFIAAIQNSADNENIVPVDMQDDEIIINQWLADDLDAEKDDSIEVSYYVMGPMRKLQERSRSFTVREVLSMEEKMLSADLTPSFPGLSDKDNCRDWQAGIPIDLKKIRDKDEKYWDVFKATPKAIVTLSAGQKLWQNRFGKLTAIRYPLSNNTAEQIKGSLLKDIDPAMGGLYPQPVRQIGARAGQQATDFGQLFLGLSMFLIVSAIILLWLVFVFGVEKRISHAGILSSMGFSNKTIKRLFLTEGSVLLGLGTVLGAAVSILYTKGMIYGLRTVWPDAVAGAVIHFYAKPATIISGSAAGVIISFFAIWFSLRKHLRQPARKLLVGNLQGALFAGKSGSRGKAGLLVGLIALFCAAGLIFGLGSSEGSVQAGVFLGSGALLLFSLMSFIRSLLVRISGRVDKPVRTMNDLMIGNIARRSGRSLAVIGSLAAGIFLVMAIGANRHDPTANWQRRDSGTGGFAIYAESSIGILNDLNEKKTRRSLGLDDEGSGSFQAVQLRVRDGDDASCFNLNRAQTPRLLGVDPEQLHRRKAFKFVKKDPVLQAVEGWDLLKADMGKDVIPAVGDYATITWSLGKSIGDDIDYIDEKGRPLKVRLVGMISNSILQGSLLIAAEEFENRFESEDGYRMLLVDAAEEDTEKVMTMFSERLMDHGIELATARDRLARFSAVEHTYLSIFQLLGGLAIILGTAGLGLVVVFNVIDRRGELGMMRAMGFEKDILSGMIVKEHLGLVVSGLLCGTIAAAIAMLPAIRTPNADIPYLSVGLTVACIAINSLIWIWIAGWSCLKGGLLDALRND